MIKMAFQHSVGVSREFEEQSEVTGADLDLDTALPVARSWLHRKCEFRKQHATPIVLPSLPNQARLALVGLETCCDTSPTSACFGLFTGPPLLPPAAR